MAPGKAKRFLHTLILGDQKQTCLFFLMLDRVQKTATFEHKINEKNTQNGS